jgi:hypothetical protein
LEEITGEAELQNLGNNAKITSKVMYLSHMDFPTILSEGSLLAVRIQFSKKN